MGIQRQHFHHHTKLLSHDSLVHHFSARSWAFLGYTTVEGGGWVRKKFCLENNLFPFIRVPFPRQISLGLMSTLNHPRALPKNIWSTWEDEEGQCPTLMAFTHNIFSLTSRPAWLRTPRCVLGRRMVRIQILHQYWYLVPALFSSSLYSRAQFSCFKGKAQWCYDYLHVLVWAISCP